MSTLCRLSVAVLMACSPGGERLPWSDAGPPRLLLCVGESASLCTHFYIDTGSSLIDYDMADGMVFVGVSTPAPYGTVPAGQTARLNVYVDRDANPVVYAETTVDAQLQGAFKFPYCGILPYRDSELRIVVTVERSDGVEYARGEARPRLTCATVEPPAACASLCAE